MSPIFTVYAIRSLVAVFVIGSLVLCQDFTCRLGLGVGIGAVVAPLTIWQTTRQARKIGQNEGRDFELADMLTEHVKLHRD